MSLIERKVVSVFKTNVSAASEATILISSLAETLPAHRINFDLDDCDRILRIEGTKIACHSIIEFLNRYNFDCCLLEVVE